jgi:hypothetical protein
MPVCAGDAGSKSPAPSWSPLKFFALSLEKGNILAPGPDPAYCNSYKPPLVIPGRAFRKKNPFTMRVIGCISGFSPDDLHLNDINDSIPFLSSAYYESTVT